MYFLTPEAQKCPNEQTRGSFVTSALMPYAGLFWISFLAATVVPLQSEAALVALLLSGDYSPWLLISVASAGNILGSLVNWLLGRKLETFKRRKWFPVKPTMLEKAKSWYHRYGRWTLLLSWMPVLGDPLTIAAGVMREPIHIFLALVAIAKVTRYLVVAAATLGLT